MAINPMAYSSKDVVLDVVNAERGKFYKVIDNSDNWLVDTRCEGWQVRDIVGHMIDVTEGYLARWDLARKGEEAPAPLGWLVMADELNKGALAFRRLSRDEAITRLKSASDKLMAIFKKLTEEEWNNFLVSHVFSGPTPSFCFPAFQIMDYGVHTWDMHWGRATKRPSWISELPGFCCLTCSLSGSIRLIKKWPKGLISAMALKLTASGWPVEDHGQRWPV